MTLKKLADRLIRESTTPFSVDDFVKTIQERWNRKISGTTLRSLKRQLSDHSFLIGMDSEDYLPLPAVLEKIGQVPLAVGLDRVEIEQRVFIPGHRLIPFVPAERPEGELTFVDAEGHPIPKQKKSFYIEDVINLYQYSGERHFPDDIQVNEWVPGKSSLTLTAWDMGKMFRELRFRPGDALLVRLLDYHRGIYQVHPYPQSRQRQDRLKMRSLYVALEEALFRLCEERDFCSSGLEKQLLRVLFSLNEKLPEVPAFSLTGFLESVEKLTVMSFEQGGVQLVPETKAPSHRFFREAVTRKPRGKQGCLEDIFQDLGLAFTEAEFISILYTIMGTERYRVETVFDLLFGGKGKLFYSPEQHQAFYELLRKSLLKIHKDLQGRESRLISELRNQTVALKLNLISILRFLESLEMPLSELPDEILVQIIELDRFCVETLVRFADRESPPDLKFIRDSRLALKIILPHMAQLEEDVGAWLELH